MSAPADARQGYYRVAFSFTGDDGSSLPEVDLNVFVVEPGSLTPYFNNVGVSDDANPGEANFDGVGYSYSAQALAAAGLSPGAKKTVDGLTFTWPDVRVASPDNIQVSGQTIPLSGSGAKLGFLGSATNAPKSGLSGAGVITYADGSTQRFTLAFSDWALGGQNWPPISEDTVVASMPYRNGGPTGRNTITVHVFSTSVPLQQGKTVKSVTLPSISGTGALHVFAMTVG